MALADVRRKNNLLVSTDCALLLSCRYFSVMLWKLSDTDPKHTSGLNRFREGSGQREAFFKYFALPASSRECHCPTSWIKGGDLMSAWIRWGDLWGNKTFFCESLPAEQQDFWWKQDLLLLWNPLALPTFSWKTAGTLLTQTKTTLIKRISRTKWVCIRHTERKLYHNTEIHTQTRKRT